MRSLFARVRATSGHQVTGHGTRLTVTTGCLVHGCCRPSWARFGPRVTGAGTTAGLAGMPATGDQRSDSMVALTMASATSELAMRAAIGTMASSTTTAQSIT